MFLRNRTPFQVTLARGHLTDDFAVLSANLEVRYRVRPDGSLELLEEWTRKDTDPPDIARAWNVHPQNELLEVDLPAERPKLLIEPPGTRVYELETALATVLFEPDEDRVTLTWAAAMPAAAVFPEQMCQEMRHAVRWS